MCRENTVSVFGKNDAANVLIQPVDDHDLEEMKNETAAIRKEYAPDDWCLLTVKVHDWNVDLTPWESEAVFGKTGFGSGAPETLAYIMKETIPDFERQYPREERKYFIGGYSLAGLFALWVVYQTDSFSGAAAVSPSVWYPGWIPYAKTHRPLSSAVYLSLGDREEKTRNKVMATVGTAIREQYQLLMDTDTKTTLEWNRGNHFVDNGIRMGKGFSWLLRNAKDPNQNA